MAVRFFFLRRLFFSLLLFLFFPPLFLLWDVFGERFPPRWVFHSLSDLFLAIRGLLARFDPGLLLPFFRFSFKGPYLGCIIFLLFALGCPPPKAAINTNKQSFCLQTFFSLFTLFFSFPAPPVTGFVQGLRVDPRGINRVVISSSRLDTFWPPLIRPFLSYGFDLLFFIDQVVLPYPKPQVNFFRSYHLT